MIYIIADDLTGATDTGVQFAKLGYHAHVDLPPYTSLAFRSQAADGRNVEVLDTETRDADGVTTRQRLRALFSAMPLTDADVVYKKIDSTMRGNLGVEIEECLYGLRKKLCLLTPSFPAQRRITAGGCLLVNDQPLGSSEYYTGQLPAAEASYLPTFLQAQTDLPIAHLELQAVMQGPNLISARIAKAFQDEIRVLIADAETPAHLDALVQGSWAHVPQILLAGSAGLAQAFAARLSQDLSATPGASQSETLGAVPVFPLLIVMGSRRAIAAQQIDLLRQNVALEEVFIDPEQMLKNREAHVRSCVQTMRQVFQTRPMLVLRPEPKYQHAESLARICATYQLGQAELARLIRDFHGELSAQIVSLAAIRTLIMTGGDTATGVCSALNIKILTIGRELLPGIPLLYARIGNDRVVNIITKAGGFGKSDTVYALYQQLTEERNRIC